MTIQDLGSLGELIAAIATVATLAYLAVQIRQNTHTVRAASINSNAETATTLSLALGQSEELTRLYFAGLAGDPTLSEDQQRQFEMLLGAYVRQLNHVFYLSREGVADPELVQEYRQALSWLVAQPGFRRYWSNWGGHNGPWLRRLIGDAIAESSPSSAA